MTQNRFRHDVDLLCHLVAQQVNGCSITSDYRGATTRRLVPGFAPAGT